MNWRDNCHPENELLHGVIDVEVESYGADSDGEITGGPGSFISRDKDGYTLFETDWHRFRIGHGEYGSARDYTITYGVVARTDVEGHMSTATCTVPVFLPTVSTR